MIALLPKKTPPLKGNNATESGRIRAKWRSSGKARPTHSIYSAVTLNKRWYSFVNYTPYAAKFCFLSQHILLMWQVGTMTVLMSCAKNHPAGDWSHFTVCKPEPRANCREVTPENSNTQFKRRWRMWPSCIWFWQNVLFQCKYMGCVKDIIVGDIKAGTRSCEGNLPSWQFLP